MYRYGRSKLGVARQEKLCLYPVRWLCYRVTCLLSRNLFRLRGKANRSPSPYASMGRQEHAAGSG